MAINKKYNRELLSKMSIDYHPLAYSHMRNPNVSTEILGNISQGNSLPEGQEEKGALYAVATLDGTLVILRFSDTCLPVSLIYHSHILVQMLVQEEQILW